MRDKLGRTAGEQSASLAAANAPILRHAARALVRNCDTLQLLGVQPVAAEGVDGSGGAAGHVGAAAPASAAAEKAEGHQPSMHSLARGGPRPAEGGDAAAALTCSQDPRPAGARAAVCSSDRTVALLCFDELQVGAACLAHAQPAAARPIANRDRGR